MTYIRDFSFNEELSHSVISQICLAYLLQFNLSGPLNINLVESSPLANYAAKYWISHTHSSGNKKSQSSFLFALMMKLLTDENAVFLNWVQMYDIDNPYWMGHRCKIAEPLYYASLAGLTEASYALLEMRADVNAKGGYYGNALQAASKQGHEAIAKLLIEKGADVNAQGGEHGNALQEASNGGHENIAKLLMEKGANVNAQGGVYGNALQAACYTGHYTNAKLLVEKGANVNAQGQFFGNALQAASDGGHEAIVKLLIDRGVHKNVMANSDEPRVSGGRVKNCWKIPKMMKKISRMLKCLNKG